MAYLTYIAKSVIEEENNNNMELKEFYQIYLKALQKALEMDHINYGYCVYSPDFYLETQISYEVDRFIDENLIDDPFIIMIEEYFDAVSHYFPNIQGVPIKNVKEKIIKEMDKLNLIYLS